jgi:CelD/BcsL family acetyltransferase involved in cellulose biosynthesis
MKSEDNIGKAAATPDSYELRWLNTTADMDAAANLWRDLDARSTAAFVGFQSFEWCRHWFENHGNVKTTPRVLMLLRDSQAIAILPMMQTRVTFGVGLLQMLGAPHTQYANILTRTGRLTAQELKVMREAMAKVGGIDAAVFTYVPENSALAQFLATQQPSQSMANASAQFEFSHLAPGQTFETTLSKDKQRDMRSRLRRLEADGGISFEVLRPGMAEYRCTIETCIAMKSEWLQQTAKVGASLAYEGHARFLASMAQAADGRDGPYAWVMKTNGTPIAIEIGILQRGHYYAYMGAFEWSLRKISPGKLLMCHVINQLSGMGVKSYDLLANPTDYKKDYSNTTSALTGHVINLTNRGSFYTKIWTQSLYPWLRHSFYRLPAGLRQNLAAIGKRDLKFGV